MRTFGWTASLRTRTDTAGAMSWTDERVDHSLYFRIAMASNLITSDGLQPTSDGLQPNY